MDGQRPDTAEGRLRCGASVDHLLAQVTDGVLPRDPGHQRGCPHCTAALAELEELWAPVRGLAARDVRAPAHLLERVMAQVRELSRDGWYAVLDGPDGDTRIAARVVGAVARLAAESVPRVTIALGGGHAATPLGAAADRALVAGSRGESATEVGLAGERVVVDVSIVVDYHASIPSVARQVRGQIERHLRTYTGLTTTAVNISVVDVSAVGQ